ncbi:putative short-chain dehydrogenase [Trypanosoma vivax]|nr:putative short-chain dehydrogenase [Trypanosoma vivax]
MFHLASSEVMAALTCLGTLLVFLCAYSLDCSWCRDFSFHDGLVLVIGCSIACRRVASGRKCVWPRETDFTSRVAIVTGASSGVGFSVAKQLVQNGWTVVLAARDEGRLLRARKEILSGNPRGRAVVLATLDLADFDSVRAFAATVLANKDYLPVSVLVNAAGVLRRHLYRCEGSGMEEMVATNAVGPMLLTELLLPLLDETAMRSGVSSRIVNVNSSCHKFLGMWHRRSPMEMLLRLHQALGKSSAANVGDEDAGGLHGGQLVNTANYEVSDFTLGNFVGYYGLSKLCLAWWTAVMAHRLSLRFLPDGKHGHLRTECLRVIIASCHPGIITTHLYRDLFPTFVLDHIIYYPSLLIGKTWAEGAQAVLRLCVEREIIHDGYYLCSFEYGGNGPIDGRSRHATDMEAARKFYAWAKERIEAQASAPARRKVSIVPDERIRRITTLKILK